jgi:hypothetical protein
MHGASHIKILNGKFDIYRKSKVTLIFMDMDIGNLCHVKGCFSPQCSEDMQRGSMACDVS